jgi:GNAT superfamily N-acetyltransferase
VRGLRLFIRPIAASDSSALSSFLPRSGAESSAPAPARGLLGKLLGELVAVVTFGDGDAGTLTVEQIFVSESMRKKRIGRAMLRETAALAAAEGKRQIAITGACSADGFLRRVGFREEGERWVLDVSE